MNYKITFPADYKNIAALRDLVFHCAKLQGFGTKQAEHLKSVVDELCNNAIEYGSQPNSEVMLTIQAEENTIRITCQDQGLGNKLKAEDLRKIMEKEVGPGEKRGRGARVIVRSFVDELDIKDAPGGGIVVSALLRKAK